LGIDIHAEHAYIITKRWNDAIKRDTAMHVFKSILLDFNIKKKHRVFVVTITLKRPTVK
jgi:hypothetical protein